MSSLDTVRALLGDTNSSSYVWQDDEINTMLGLYSAPARAAYHLALAKSVYYAGRPNRSIDGLSVNYGELSNRYSQIASTLKDLALDADLSGAVGIYAGGMTISEKTSDRANIGRTQPRFVSGQFSDRSGSYEGWGDK